ncbi:MAG: hypothetical protein ACTSYD_06265 [Candidatus Heimdallarchaeaceae archaeon]
MHLSKIDTRPFNFFVEMEMERDNLYDSFTHLDEPKEISAVWIQFAESCAKNLSVINTMASLAYERVHEVYNNIQQGGENVIPLHELLYGDFSKQILTLTDFQLRLAILTYVYSQVRNKGVFGKSPETTTYEHYVHAKETIDRTLYRILNNELPKPNSISEDDTKSLTIVPDIDDLLAIIMPLLKLEHTKRLIPLYNSLIEVATDENIFKIGDYDRLQGITLVTHIINIAREASDKFWWDDPISELSIVSHAEEHFQAVIKLWEKTGRQLATYSEQIKRELLPITKAEQQYAISKHFQLLADYALEKGDLHHSNLYLEESLKQLKKAQRFLKKNPEQFQDLLEKYQRKTKNLTIFRDLTLLANHYNCIVDALYNNEKEEAINKCMKIEKILTSIEESGTMPYIYGVSVAYASTSTVINELLSQEIDNLTIINRLASQFNFPLRAMKSAIKSVNVDELYVNDEKPELSFEKLQTLNDKMWYLEKATELLPPFIPDRDKLRAEIHALRNYVKSLLTENQIYFDADYNLVLDLILRARAHYYAKKANKYATQTKNRHLEELINERLTTTKILAMITESNLVLLALQSAYNNEFRALVSETIKILEILPQIPESIVKSIEAQFEVKSDMYNLLELIRIDTDELNAIKVPASIKGQEINWDFLQRRRIFISQIEQMAEVLKHMLLGELYARLKDNVAESHFTKAGDILYKMSNELGKITEYLEESQKELPNNLYVLSLSMRERGRAMRDRRKIKEKLPYEEIIAIMDGFIIYM